MNSYKDGYWEKSSKTNEVELYAHFGSGSRL